MYNLRTFYCLMQKGMTARAIIPVNIFVCSIFIVFFSVHAISNIVFKVSLLLSLRASGGFRLPLPALQLQIYVTLY